MSELFGQDNIPIIGKRRHKNLFQQIVKNDTTELIELGNQSFNLLLIIMIL